MKAAPADVTLVGAIVGAVAAMAALGARALPYALTVLLLVAAWRIWNASKRLDGLTQGLRAHWLELPGAQLSGEMVFVHDGEQPLLIFLGHEANELMARVSTVVGDLPMAFRCWRPGVAPPALRADGAKVSGPALTREPITEGHLGGRMEVETNDALRLQMLFDPDVSAAILTLSNSYPKAFEALTYDGKYLTAHFRGPLVADPDQVTRAARTLWRRFIS